MHNIKIRFFLLIATMGLSAAVLASTPPHTDAMHYMDYKLDRLLGLEMGYTSNIKGLETFKSKPQDILNVDMLALTFTYNFD